MDYNVLHVKIVAASETLFQEKPVMEWFAKAAGQSVNNLKFNPIAPEDMVSYHTTEPLF